MSQREDDDQNKVIGVVLIAVVSLACALAVGVGVSRMGKKAVTESATPAQAQAVSAPAEPAAAPEPVALKDTESAVRVIDGVVKFYFASGSAQLAQGANEALQSVVQAAQAGKTLKISGYHDSTGSAQANAVLAAQRAQAVKNALIQLGVAETALQLVKPESIAQTEGANAQARRVEVSIQ